MKKEQKNKRGPKTKSDSEKLHPLPLKTSLQTQEELRNIAEQKDQSVSETARDAIDLGIELIYRDGEILPIKRD